MGLFDFFHLPPDPIVSFNLNSRGPFGPGSPVSGHLTITIPPDPKAKTQPPPPRQLSVANIAFYGRSATANYRTQTSGAGNTQTTQTIHYEDDVCLFHQGYMLMNSQVLDETQPAQCSFGFSFSHMALMAYHFLLRTPTAGDDVAHTSATTELNKARCLQVLFSTGAAATMLLWSTPLS